MLVPDVLFWSTCYEKRKQTMTIFEEAEAFSRAKKEREKQLKEKYHDITWDKFLEIKERLNSKKKKTWDDLQLLDVVHEIIRTRCKFCERHRSPCEYDVSGCSCSQNNNWDWEVSSSDYYFNYRVCPYNPQNNNSPTECPFYQNK